MCTVYTSYSVHCGLCVVHSTQTYTKARGIQDIYDLRTLCCFSKALHYFSSELQTVLKYICVLAHWALGREASEASLVVMRHFSPWRAPPDNFIFMLYFLSYPDPPDYDNDEEGGHCDEGDGVQYFN